jgi:hypothetical protein
MLGLNPEMEVAFMLQGGIAFLRDQLDEAVRLCERATDLAPSGGEQVQ